MKAWHNGVELDAEFVVVDEDGEQRVVFSSSGGTPRLNPDYAKAQTVVLTRLASLGAVISDATVESLQALTKFPSRDERRLGSMKPGSAGAELTYPLKLADWEPNELRKAMARAQQKTATTGKGDGSGGNPTKRIALSIQTTPKHSSAELEAVLAASTPLVVL